MKSYRDNVVELIELVKHDLGYNIFEKNKFRIVSIRILNSIKQELGIEAEIRWNPGGDAVSGDAILHGDNIYINFSQSCLGYDYGFMYRGCKDRKDYRGYTNRWMKWEELLDLESACQSFKDCMELAKKAGELNV